MPERRAAEDDRETLFVARTWRVRVLIQIACIVQALGWIALVSALGFDDDENNALALTILTVFVAGPPFLAVFPMIKLRPDGRLVLRGWTQTKRSTVMEVVRLSMTQYGLRFEFADGSEFTSVIFQATHYFSRPRVLDFVDAITRTPGFAQSYDPWDVLQRGGIELYTRSEVGPESAPAPH